MANSPTRPVYNFSTGYFDMVKQDPAQEVTVATSGAMFSSIQAAIDSITDASSTKPYTVRVFPGIYTENIIGKDWVNIANGIPGEVVIVGSIAVTGVTSFGIKGVTIRWTPTADNQAALTLAGSSFYIGDVTVQLTGTGDYICDGIRVTTSSTCIVSNVAVVDFRSGTISKEFHGFRVDGAGTYALYTVNVSVRANYTSATACLGQIDSTGSFTMSGGALIFKDTTGTFSGTVKGICCTTASTATRLITGTQIKLEGISGGTAVGYSLNSGGNAANITYSGCSLVISGFTNEYSTDTAVGDTQFVRLNSVNKVLVKNGAGLSIITPTDEVTSGFGQWSTVGATYWSFTPATASFTLDRRLTGIVESAPVVAAAAQTLSGGSALTNFVVNYVYADSSGILKSTITKTSALSTENVVLFKVFSDGTNSVVVKENHPVTVNNGINNVWHKVIGSQLENNGGGTIATLVAANRTVRLNGACTAIDHGLETIIPDSAGLNISFTSFYTGASGTTIDGTGITAIPSKWQNTATTVANAANNDRIVVRVGVLLDSLNSSSPQYVYVYHNAVYGTNSAAANAITAGNITQFSPALIDLEVIQLGYVTIQANGSGGGTIVATTVAKQVIGSNFTAGAASTSAGLVTTSVANFDGILSAADTSVQMALDTIDDTAAKKATSSTDNAVVRFDGTGGQLLQNSNVIIDDSGNITGCPSVTASTSLITPLVKAADANGVKFQENGGAEVGSFSDAGSWTLGPSGYTGDHTVNGSVNASNALIASGIEAALVASRGSLTFFSGATRVISYGANVSTAGITQFRQRSGDASATIDTVSGEISGAGAWTLGPSSGSAQHTIRGGTATALVVNNTGSGAVYIATQVAGISYGYWGSNATNCLEVLGSDGSTIRGKCDAAGAWTLGPSSGAAAVTIPNLSGTGSRAVNASATGVLSAASDARLKTEVTDAAIPGLSEVMRLRTVAYKWNDDIEKRGDAAAVEIGFFANEAAQVIPSSAPMGIDGYYGFYDRAVTGAVVKSIQELNALIEAQQEMITSQQALLSELTARIAALEAK